MKILHIARTTIPPQPPVRLPGLPEFPRPHAEAEATEAFAVHVTGFGRDGGEQTVLLPVEGDTSNGYTPVPTAAAAAWWAREFHRRDLEAERCGD